METKNMTICFTPPSFPTSFPGVSNPSTSLLADRYMCLFSVKSVTAWALFTRPYIFTYWKRKYEYTNIWQNNNHKAWTETGFHFDNTKGARCFVLFYITWKSKHKSGYLHHDNSIYCIHCRFVLNTLWGKHQPFRKHKLTDAHDSLELQVLTEVRKLCHFFCQENSQVCKLLISCFLNFIYNSCIWLTQFSQSFLTYTT